MRVLEDNRDNGDNGLILNSMLSEDNNKYNFTSLKAGCLLRIFDEVSLMGKVDYLGLQG